MGPDKVGLPEEPEPTVLDWFKSLLRLRPIPIPEDGSWASDSLPVKSMVPEKPKRQAATAIGQGLSFSHFSVPAALILALIAQVSLETHDAEIWVSVGLYLVAIVLITLSMRAKTLTVKTPLPAEGSGSNLEVRIPYLATGSVLAILTYLGSGENQFRLSTVLLWTAAMICIVLAFWEGPISLSPLKARWTGWLRKPRVQLTVDAWKLAILLALIVSAYFRFVRLAEIPYEMWSDHAEKLLDVSDVLAGRTSIFFLRNTGREPLQMYMAAATAKWLGTGISFLTLKIGTALAGLITLPYLYLFAKEIGGREVGLAALLLSGVAYWPNVISRVGLRFPLYALFAAPAMYYLVRGLRLQRRNDLLLCGLAIGLGLYGYSPARVIPLTIAIGVALFLIHRDGRGRRWRVLAWLGIAALVALIAFLPLLRAAHDVPELFLQRMFTRIATEERQYPGPPFHIFLSNLWNGLRMFNWDNGRIWAISIPQRPALDWVTGSFFVIGLAMLVNRYLKERDWRDVFVMLSIPILMAPSILSLAFPAENPAPNRASGAIVPVFTIAALPLAALPSWATSVWKGRGNRVIGLGLAGGLFAIAAANNYRLVTQEYAEQVRLSGWNTREAGALVRGFAQSIGSYHTSYVISYPHWMDTRLVGMHAGRPTRDFGIWPGDLEELPPSDAAQIFLLNTQDEQSLELLKNRYPTGSLLRWESSQEGKDFLIYFIPPRQDGTLRPEAG